MSTTLILEIQSPHIDSEAKFKSAIEILSKATHTSIELSHSSKAEPTPYKALKHLSESIIEDTQADLLRVWKTIRSTWLRKSLKKAKDDLPFKLNGRIYINPKTGKMLTVKDWKQIQKDLTKVFSYLYGQSSDRLVKQAMAMGKIIHSMVPDDRYMTSLSGIDVQSGANDIVQDKAFRNILTWADVHTGELLQDVTTRSRKKIVERLMEGYKHKMSSKDLEEALFQDFADLNKDWRRIVETETASNFNNGYLTSELAARKDKKPVFMMGISGAGACAWCAGHVDGQIFALVDSPPATGETVTIDGTEYIAIWPGKSNYGRTRANWWVAAGVQHPHCRCTFTEYNPEIAEYEKRLRAAMDNNS